MAQNAPTFVDESRERIHSARERLDSEFDKARKDLNARRKRLEKQLNKNRKAFEKEFSKNRKSFEKQAEKLRKDFEKTAIAKQLNRWRSGAEEQIEGALDGVLSTLQIATQSDVKKLDRKLSKISKQLKNFEGGTPSAKRAGTSRPGTSHASA